MPLDSAELNRNPRLDGLQLKQACIVPPLPLRVLVSRSGLEMSRTRSASAERETTSNI